MTANRDRPSRRRVLVASGGLTAAGLWPRLASAQTATPPAPVRDWLRRATDPPFRVPLDYVGLHSNHGLGGPVAAPTYAYDAIRSHDTDDGQDWPALQWSRIERQPGVYDWTGVDAWI